MALLRLYFMDLIAFVPVAGKLWVLLPDGTGGGQVGELSIPEHFPVILFNTAATNGGQWTDISIKEGELGLTGSRMGTLWRLNREEISFEGVAAPSGADPGIQVLGQGETLSSEFPAAENVTSAAWIPKMKDVVEAAGQIDPACIGPTVETDKIIARILLDKGTFKISGFASREHPSVTAGGPPRVEVGKYEFKTVNALGGSEGRAIADLAVAELPLEGDTVKVKATTFDGQNSRSLDLSAQNGVIEAVVANVSKLLTVEESKKEDPNRGPHFALYYKLAAGVADTKPIPHRTGGDFEVSSIVQKPPGIIKELIEDRSSAFRRPVCALSQFS